MKRVFYMLFIGAFAASLAACSSNPSETSADSSKPSGFFDRLKPEPKISVPAGTRLRVALVEGVSTTKNSPGDRFTATLAEPVIVDGKMVLEKGTKVRGSVVDHDNKPVKERTLVVIPGRQPELVSYCIPGARVSAVTI